jgi:hypothetical protein
MTHASSIPDHSARTIGVPSISALQHAQASAFACQHFSKSSRSLPTSVEPYVPERCFAVRGRVKPEGEKLTSEGLKGPKRADLLKCRAPRRRRNRTRRTSGRRLRSGYPGAHEVTRLVLLPSGPDTVHGAPLPGTRPSTPAAPVSTEPGSRLGRGSRPC